MSWRAGEKNWLKQSPRRMVSPASGCVRGEEPLSGGGWFSSSLLGREAGTGERLKGWLPVTCINPGQKGTASRIAATIRHNRAGETPDNLNNVDN